MNDKVMKEFIRGAFAVVVACITTFGGTYALYHSKIVELEKQIEVLTQDTNSSSPDDKGTDVTIDTEQKVDSKGEMQELLSVCSPYEKKNYSAPETISIMGIEYHKGFWLSDDTTNAYAYFNLDKKYSEFIFKVGHVDGSKMNDRTLKIYLDNELQKIELQSNMITTEYRIPVNGVNQMRLELDSLSGDPKYGFVDVFLR